MSELVINQTKDKIQVCILENNSICEIYTYSDEESNIMGNIYLGKVMNVVDGMQAAFLDIGMEKNSFISIKDALPKIDSVKEEQTINSKISDVLSEKQDVIVQVKKIPSQMKGARVSTHITIPGDYLVLMPGVEFVTVSQKISLDEEKERLLKIVKNSLPKGFGIIVRTNAEGVVDETIENDLKILLSKWKNIVEKSQTHSSPILLYDEHELIPKVGRELVNHNLKKIYINSDKLYAEMKEYLKDKNAKQEIYIEKIKTDDLIDYFGLTSELLEAGNRKIWLKNGGYIVIDKTEALTAIDVNSGKYIGNSNLETTALEVNSAAAKEIMKQIRLKDIGGIIVIDYIDLANKEHQKEIIEIMKQEAQKDRSKIDIKGYTELNLVELTRKMMNI